MIFLSILILTKGANVGVKALYFVVVILAISLILFFVGTTSFAETSNFSFSKAEFRNFDNFFVVFAIIFPAFTGMTAGVGLSGDLKNPGKSIPLGTTSATIIGMIIYFFIAYKLTISASPEDLINNQFIMGKIAKWGIIAIPIGLAASTISSALGSVMVAPRTLQALAGDKSFPSFSINEWLSKGREKDSEPVNASLATCFIAMIFVIMGDINAVAEIISMFFMVTYGSLSLISLLNHFGSSPAYRPSFKSKWYISLIGFVASVWIMFKINMTYAVAAIILMTLLYIYINSYHKSRKGLVSIFANSIFQLNRNLQVFLQKQKNKKQFVEWRPSAICISKNSFERDNAFRLLNWISYKYGFGTYLHRIEGYYSKTTHKQSEIELKKLIKNVGMNNYVYIDTIISPSYTSAIAQAIQIPGIAGMENNMVIFEYDKMNPEKGLKDIVDNFKLVNAGDFDVCILASSSKPVYYKNGIHIWIKNADNENGNLMILLSFIISGHSDWKNASIKIFEICKPKNAKKVRQELNELVKSGRLPITSQNIEIIIQNEDVSSKSIINEHSNDAALTIIGFREEMLTKDNSKYFTGYDNLGNILFVNSHNKKDID